MDKLIEYSTIYYQHATLLQLITNSFHQPFLAAYHILLFILKSNSSFIKFTKLFIDLSVNHNCSKKKENTNSIYTIYSIYQENI